MRAMLSMILALGVGVLPAAGVAAQPSDGSALADPTVATAQVELLVLHATNDGKGIDPAIGKLPQLSKPPLSAYDSYKLLGRSTVALKQGEAHDSKIAGGSTVKLSLNGVTGEGKARKFSLSASVQKPGGASFLPLLEISARSGEPFFVAGQAHGKGVIVLGFKVLP